MSTPIRSRLARPWVLISVAVVVTTAGVAGAALGSDPTPIGTPPSAITPLAATVLHAPRPVLASDDRQHLPYELFVTNPTSSVMQLTKLETLGDGTVINTLAGAALDATTRPLAPGSGTAIGPAQVTRVFMDATFAKSASLPDALSHRFTFTLTPTGRPPTTATVESAATPVVDDDPVEISPPVTGTRWLVGGGCCFPASYHRTATLPVNGAFHAPERYAIDFVELNQDNELYAGPQDALSSYAYFGVKVRSVAKGVVVGLLDGLPEQTPPVFPAGATAETAGGNYVMIDIGHGHFAYYAHLQPGSLRVHVGDRVKDGQTIARLGNTGNSDGPHLHFQITDGPIPLASEGVPYEFTSFTTRGTLTSDPALLQQGQSGVIGPVGAGKHHDRLPLENEVIDFPSR